MNSAGWGSSVQPDKKIQHVVGTIIVLTLVLAVVFLSPFVFVKAKESIPADTTHNIFNETQDENVAAPSTSPTAPSERAAAPDSNSITAPSGCSGLLLNDQLLRDTLFASSCVLSWRN